MGRRLVWTVSTRVWALPRRPGFEETPGWVVASFVLLGSLLLLASTVLGAACMVAETGEHPALLREKVCSPAGTTISAIRVLEERGLRASLMEAVGAATRRSHELGEEKNRS